jgi:hypothetical protein
VGEETEEAVVPLQAYRVACLFVVFTLLLLPAYFLYAWPVRRRR